MDIYKRHEIAYLLYGLLKTIQWPANAQEPDYVAKLVNELPSFITKALTEVLPGQHFAVGGAFIHQKPLIHFTNKTGYKDPELGDLLIVCREKRFSGYVYNALLLQAKLSSVPFRAPIPNDHQYLLYSEWPEFEYKRAGWLNGKKRNVLPKTITQGAQYLLIDDSHNCDLFTATVDRPLTSSKLFARTLAAVLSFDAGRTFQATSPRDDWSQMILDLLRISAASLFNRRRSGYVGAHRWNGDDAFNYFLDPDMQEKEINSLLQFRDVNSDEAETGISVICVDLGSSTREE
jgi:hypothetical protein